MPAIARIGRAFAERRIELRLTQQTLADLAGVSRSSSVVEIADILGMHIDVSTAAE